MMTKSASKMENNENYNSGKKYVANLTNTEERLKGLMRD